MYVVVIILGFAGWVDLIIYGAKLNTIAYFLFAMLIILFDINKKLEHVSKEQK